MFFNCFNVAPIPLTLGLVVDNRISVGNVVTRATLLEQHFSNVYRGVNQILPSYFAEYFRTIPGLWCQSSMVMASNTPTTSRTTFPNGDPDFGDVVDSMAGGAEESEVQKVGVTVNNGPSSSITLSQRRTAALDKHRSCDDAHDNTCSGKDSEANKNESNGQDSEAKPFEVQWDGDDDPMSPKNMSKANKWVVVFLISAGSTCV